MKIAIASNGSDLESSVGSKLGLSPYLIVIDLNTMDYQSFKLSTKASSGGIPLEPITVAINQEAKAIVAGYVSPRVSSSLASHGIEVVSSVRGRVRDVAESFKYGELHKVMASRVGTPSIKTIQEQNINLAFKKTVNQFFSVLPVLIGVVFLIGLFKAFINEKLLFTIFTGKPLLDTFSGSTLGSILAGNPVNSYVIGDVLQKMGVSLYAVTALMATWVTVGLIQLPAEIAGLELRFAVVRNVTCYFVSMLVAVTTVFLMRLY